MKIHILGVCGTFMSGVAILARQSGHVVTGSDMNVYPPMSIQLECQGIELMEGYDPANIADDVECVIVGNVIKRGNPAIEYVLDKGIPYMSGPEWLAKNILQNRWVLAVAGTHGKTTTTSLLAWIMQHAGLEPGFLVGGIPQNFGVSARLGNQPFFVIEADEYDSAFFDKRSKFIHYHAKTLVLNNLEFDHADIFTDLDAIKLQFQYLLRTVPGNGLVLHHAEDVNIKDVLSKGCWTPVVGFASKNSSWRAELIKPDGSAFLLIHDGKVAGEVCWSLLGKHNIDNALAAISAAHHAGVTPVQAIAALSSFENVKRRLEVKGAVKDIVVYDDFAHHPTAIETTLSGLRAKIGNARLIAVLEFGSYTMRSGIHKERIQQALHDADMVICKSTEQDWGLKNILAGFSQPTELYRDVDNLVSHLAPSLRPGDHVVIMSNSGFGGIHEKLLATLENG